jgi:hypothetical protein
MSIQNNQYRWGKIVDVNPFETYDVPFGKRINDKNKDFTDTIGNRTLQGMRSVCFVLS